MAREFNFDGLVGPSHNYGGLAFGNIASQTNEGQASNPRQAALQGLKKMRTLHGLGLAQAIFPPHMRPDLDFARRLGFTGTDAEVLDKSYREAPQVLAASYSASSMWTANAATVSPSADSADGRVHFTPANLQNQAHRSIEHVTASRILQAIFRDPERFAHHEALPSTAALGDEGAANHTRLAPTHGAPGLQMFVYGASAAAPWDPRPKIFPARQTLEASQAIMRLHQLDPERVVVTQQNPEVIDAGVFHNDVISVGNGNVLLFHEHAFLDRDGALEALAAKYSTIADDELRLLEVKAEDLTVVQAVNTYLFNSQLVTTPKGRTALIAPTECEQSDRVRPLVERWVESDAPVDEVHYFDLRQSMRGGGGPACLRLRVVLTDEEAAAIAPGVIFDDALDAKLVAWVERHYREKIEPRDLADPSLLEGSRAALDELTQLLGVGAIYPFQL